MAEPFAVPGRRTKQRRVGGEPAKVQVLVVFPREADASEHLEAVLCQVDAGVGDVRLGHARRFDPVAVVGSEALGRGERDRVAHLQRETRVGEKMLDRLERPDRAPERDSVLRVSHGCREIPIHRADRLGCDQDACGRQLRLDEVSRAGSAYQRSGRHLGVGEAHLAEGSGEVRPGSTRRSTPAQADPGHHSGVAGEVPTHRVATLVRRGAAVHEHRNAP